jgi:hypothetical protein
MRRRRRLGGVSLFLLFGRQSLLLRDVSLLQLLRLLLMLTLEFLGARGVCLLLRQALMLELLLLLHPLPFLILLRAQLLLLLELFALERRVGARGRRGHGRLRQLARVNGGRCGTADLYLRDRWCR